MAVRAEQGQVGEPGLGLPGDVQGSAVMAFDVIESVGAVRVAEVEGADLARDAKAALLSVGELPGAELGVTFTAQMGTQGQAAFRGGDGVTVEVWQIAAVRRAMHEQLADAGGHGVHPVRVGAEVFEYFLVELVAVAGRTAVGGVLAGDVQGLAGNSGGVAEVWIPPVEGVDRRALQQFRQRLGSFVGGIDLLPAVGLDQLAGKDDLVARPVQVGQVPYREAERFQPPGDRVFAAAEVSGAELHTGADAMGVADDGLGVIQLAAIVQKITAGRSEAGRAQERVSAETIELRDSGQYSRAGHIAKGHHLNVRLACDTRPPNPVGKMDR